MSCCKKNKKIIKASCPLCGVLGNHIHYIAVGSVVKEDVFSEVTEEAYFVCGSNRCEVVFFNQSGDRIFLLQDINMNGDFDGISKKNKCNQCGSGASCSACS